MKKKENTIEWKILERNGTFLVGTMRTTGSWLFNTKAKEFCCGWKGFNIPAHFETIWEAREFVVKITKPDTYHDLK